MAQVVDKPVGSDRKHNPFRTRAVVIGLLACFPACYAVTNQLVSNIFSLMVPPISVLLFLTLLNAPLRLTFPRWALTQSDFVVVFSIVACACAVSGEWSVINHAATFAMPFHAETNPTFRDYLIKYMPDWLVIKDIAKVQDLEGGGRTMAYVWGRMGTYLPVYLGWATLFLPVLFGMACINSLMRGAWCERERLTFPQIQLPVAMCEGGGFGAMWKSQYTWIAFGIMFGINILNGLNYLYPNLPAIPVKTLFRIDHALTEPPLSNIGDFRLSIYPFMMAVGFFMPSDLLLSMVVFFLLRKLTHVVLAANGIPQSTFSGTAIAPGPPFFDEQTWGAVIAVFLGAWWASRDYLKGVWQDIRTGRREADGGITHRWAFIGLIGSFVAVTVFGVIGGQLPIWYLIPYYALFLIFSVVLTRIRAQLGPPTHEFAFFGSNSIMHRFLGNRWLTNHQATFVSQGFIIMNRIYRNHPMPYQLEAMKMGQMEGMNQKKMFLAIMAASILGFFLAFFFLQVLAYRTGSLGWNDAPTYLNHILRDRSGPDIQGITMTIFGFSMVMILDAIRFRFPGFPLHPAGYVLSMNYGVDYYWSGMLMALLIKNFIQRYYGLRGYDKLRMVALGILLGEYAGETIWMGMALITRQSTYTISFNDRSLGLQ